MQRTLWSELTSDPATETSPAWSPDGATIAFYRYLPEGRAAVVTVSALGGSEKILLEIPFVRSAHILSPYLAWSPDGEWLAMVERDSPKPFSLSLLSTRTRERRRLTNPPADWADWTGDSGPAFSPDGRNLAFIRTKSVGIDDIYVLTLSDDLNPRGGPRRVTTLGAFTNSPTLCRGASTVPSHFLQHIYLHMQRHTCCTTHDGSHAG